MSQFTIYLVDDDDDDIYLARLTFKEHFPRWTLISFNDGQELVDFLNKQAVQKLPDLIVLDLNMPRLTGFETLTVLKQHPFWQQVPVVILTTSSNAEDRTRSAQLGAVAFITKPATVDQLSRIIVDGKAVGQPGH